MTPAAPAPSGAPLKLQIGGTLIPGEHVYIERPTDRLLLELLQQGEYCNILTSRQMGKSSLMMQTAAKLSSAGYHVATPDASGLGSQVDAGHWYRGLLEEIADELGLDVSVDEWWRDCTDATPNQRLLRFFREEIAARLPGDKPVVIFVDEIDSTLKLDYTDDFFTAIRAMYNQRAKTEEYRRMVFCLVGVATPNELIKNPRTTPYNIGRTFELEDFDPERDDLRPLYRAVCPDEVRGEAIVRETIRQTGGHPYLTVRLCEELAATGFPAPEDVSRAASVRFASLDSLKSDVHFDQILRFINDRVEDKLSTLELYRRVISGKTVPDQTTPAHINLKLIGLVKRDARPNLIPRNPIYRRLFTDAWAKSAMPPVERRVRTARQVAVAAVILLLLSLGSYFELIYPRDRINTLNQVMDDYQLAQRNYRELKRVPFYSGKANELMAAFYERRAARDEQAGNRDQALLWRVNAQALRPNYSGARRLSTLVNSDYPKLLLTFRHPTEMERGASGIPNYRPFAPGFVFAISHDGKTVVTGGENGVAQLWNAKTGQPIGQPMRHESPELSDQVSDGRRQERAIPSTIYAVTFSPDGRRVLTSSSDATARLWSADSGAPLGQPLRHKNSVRTVAFSPDGRRVLTGSDDQTARLWSADSGAPLGQPLRHKNSVRTVAFSPDGQRVLTGSDDNTARLWNADSGSPIGQPMRHVSRVVAVAYSPDGRRVLTGSDDNTARLWNADSGVPLGQPLHHASLVRAVAYSPDGRRVLTGSDDNTARLWNADSGTPIGQPLRHDSLVRAVAFSPDGRRVLTGSSDNTARLWSADSGAPIGPPLRHDSKVLTIAFVPNSCNVLTGSSDNTARLWNADSGVPIGQPMRHADWVLAVAFSPDSRRVLTGSSDNTARLWSADSGAPIGQPLRHDSLVRAVAFSPDGQRVLTGSDDNTARLWSADSGAPIGQPLRHDGRVLAVAFSPNGRRVLTGSYDMTARLWNADSGAPIGQLLRHDALVRTVAFSPDGQRVLTGSYDNTTRLWDADSGAPIGQPLRHDSLVRTVAFSPDGRLVLTDGYDNAARLWDADSGAPIGQPLRHDSLVRAVAFSPDGQRALAFTDWWVHSANLDGDGWHPFVSRLLPGPFRENGQCHFLDKAGSRIQLGLGVTGDSTQVVTIGIDSAEAAPLEGDPRALLEEWQKRLGLRINPAGEVVPLWP